MNTTLLFDFQVDKENNKIFVKREFASAIPHVWDAWTKPELLDQWWAPKPWKAVTKSMDFREGGRWLYYMEGPEGERHYSFLDFEKIVPQRSYVGNSGFCDENGSVNAEMPSSEWANEFAQTDSKTLVTIVITLASLEALEILIAMGFKEGFTAGLSNLDELLASQDN